MRDYLDKLSVPRCMPIDLSLAVVISCSFVIALCVLLEPIWQTNDDVLMSMIAHGYGVAAEGSAMFPPESMSKVLWGHVVRAIPTVNGVLGYSTATFVSLIAVGVVIIYAIRRAGFSLILAVALLFLILTRLVLWPQFTVNAGLLTVGAVICSWLYENKKRVGTLLAAAILALMGFLVREGEFLFVALVALPLLPWSTMAKDRNAKIAIFALVLAISGSKFINYLAYDGKEWDEVKRFFPIVNSLLNYDHMQGIENSPELFEAYGLSENDINLYSATLHFDPEIMNPDTWEAILSTNNPQTWRSIGWHSFNPNIHRSFRTGVEALFYPIMLPLTLAAGVLFLFRPSVRLLVAWGIYLAALTLLLSLGRGALFRVYLPPLSLLVIAPLFVGRALLFLDKRAVKIFMAASISFLAAANARSSINFNQENAAKAHHLRVEYAQLPSGEKFHVKGYAHEKIFPTLRIPPAFSTKS